MIPDHLFPAAWTPPDKEWANLQLDHVPQATQIEIIGGFTPILQDAVWGPHLRLAFALRLPGLDVTLTDVYRHAQPIRDAQWIVLIRYSRHDPIAMKPRLATAQIPGVANVASLADIYHIALRGVRDGSLPASTGAAVEEAIEKVMSVSRQELRPYNPSAQDATVVPSYRRLLYHQTGQDKVDDPYLSTSCVLPCLDSSDCATVTAIRNGADFLDFFLVPGRRIRVLWPPNPDAAAGLYMTRSIQPAKLNQIENSAMKMVIEREVAYAYPPALDMWPHVSVRNPNLA